jgi:ankyrin repeat protein
VQDQQAGGTALHYAAQNNHVAVVKVLLEGDTGPGIGSLLDQTGSAPLVWAVFNGSLDVVNFLLEEGQSPLAMWHSLLRLTGVQ